MPRGSIWSGSISFGLINIPVSVQSAEEDRDLSFHMLDQRNLALIRYQKTNDKTGKIVPYNQIVKGYEYEKNRYIILTPEDFKRANPKATQMIDIQDFVKASDIDLMMFEKPYYLVPAKGAEKSYALLCQALAESEKVAIATVVMHTKEHLTCIFPRGNHLVLEILRFSHQLKNADKVAPVQKSSSVKLRPQEIRMAEQLIKTMTSSWKPEQYKDTYYSDFKKHIEKRIAAGKGKWVEKAEDQTEPARPTSSRDLMALLKQSLNKKISKTKSREPRAGLH